MDLFHTNFLVRTFISIGRLRLSIFQVRIGLKKLRNSCHLIIYVAKWVPVLGLLKMGYDYRPCEKT